MATNTTATSQTYNGNGSQATFSISFSFLENTEIDVTVGGVLKTLGTHYNISGGSITFTSGNIPPSGTNNIKFQRDTDISAKKVDFADGSVLTETDLDNNSDQVLFAQQEIIDKLGGIEEGATGDQTAAEIRTLVGSASDSNVLTDALLSKLNAIESGATGNQTAAEIRTLVESASDSNVFTDADHTKLNGIEASATADQTAAEIRTLVESATDSNVFTDADHTKLNGIEASATADQTVSEIKSLIAGSPLDASHLATNSVTTSEIADDAVTQPKIADNAVITATIADGVVNSSKLADNSVTTAKIADAELTTLAGMQSATASKLADSTALTSDIADLNQIDGMAKQTTITDDDTKFPTSGAVVDYVSGQLDDIGGFESIANELSFPNTQAPNGVSISIADAAGLVVNGSGVSTTGRTLNGTTVTINNIPSNFHSSTIAAGIRFIVTSTGSGQIYNYHKATLAESDLVSLSGDINDFNERYRVGSTNPTSNNDAGDLFFNTSTQKLLVYNGTSGAWEEAQSIGNFFISTLSPAFDGSTTNFTLSNAPTNAQQVLLIIEGVLQKPNSGTSISSSDEGFVLDGSTVKLAVAPAVGASYHAVVMGSTVNIGVPSNNTVTSAILQNGSVINSKLGADAVDGSKIADDSINSEHYVDGSIDTAHIADDAVNAAKIADGAVTSAKIANGTIATADIADGAITSVKIANGIVGTDDLAAGGVVTVKIADDAVTTAKIANSAVTDAKINGMAASKLTGALPAIDGSNLTGIASAGQARNFLINGAMQVNQRKQTGTLGYFNPVTATIYTLDRWRFSVGSSFDTNSARITQDSSGPNGFSNSWKIEIFNTQTPSGSENAGVEQKIEAQDLQGLAYGTSAAKTMTLSFYVKSYKTGTYCVQIMQEDGGFYQLHEYTINSSNTWEKKTITIVGNTSNAINNDNGTGLRVIWALACGSSDHVSATSSWASGSSYYATSNQVNLWDNGSNDWYLTGCQLEVGSTATDYAHETFAETIQKCFKYFYKTYDYNTAIGTATSVGAFVYSLPVSQTYAAMPSVRYPVEMRDNPTVTAYSTQNTNTTGKMSADSSDKTISIHYIGRKGHFPFVNNSSSGISVNVWLRHQFTAESEL